MSPKVKFAVLEYLGEELGQPSEYEPDSEDIFYDIGKTETVKDKIDIFSLGYGDYFQYTLDRDFTIPAMRSKIVADLIDIGDNYLIVEGILEIT